MDSSPRSRPKRYHCTVKDCGKSFTRSSHLHRHALNHEDIKFNCDRCGALFRRKDLLERHNIRHATKDQDAGGVGLGVLDTKRKHFVLDQQSSSSTLGNECATPSRQEVGITPIRGGLPQSSELSPSTTLLSENLENVHGDQIQIQAGQMHDGSDFELADEIPTAPNNFDFMDIYHDEAFDALHLDLTGFPVKQSRNSGRELLTLHDTQSTRTDTAIGGHEGEPRAEICFDPSQSQQNQARMDRLTLRNVLSSASSQPPEMPQYIIQAVNRTPYTIRGRLSKLDLILSAAKRNEILALLEEIQPLKPDGSVVDQECTELSLGSMQVYTDLFFAYYNRAYPILHEPTIDLSTADVLLLLSIVLLGATYHSKEAHQVSVYLYDAIIPQILAELISRPTFDLATLQAILILESYGLYRAGPHQRENAILIHGLLLSAIRRISRYHVRARITLPTQLTHHDRDWHEFAHAEQYKRLILFFFLWDTQNVSLYSCMPSMSTQTVQIEVPLPEVIWNAPSEQEWKAVMSRHKDLEVPTLPSLVSAFLKDSLPPVNVNSLDKFTIILILHGLMSMCNDMLHFDNRSIYLIDDVEAAAGWSSWRRQMASALDSWRARFDAYSMTNSIAPSFHERDRNEIRNVLQRDSVCILALYHLAHIIIGADLRHLQVAAGAPAIFGHLVSTSDREESRALITDWARNQQEGSNHAAWHAAQLIREGLLGLEAWDAGGIIHYPWCLYISTLTIWAFHRFAKATSDVVPSARESCRVMDSCDRMCVSDSIGSMTHVISIMAASTPSNLRQTLGKCCTHGLAKEVAKSLKSIRWTAAFEAMKILESLMLED